MEIDIARDSLIPIIGVNECGKTTILHALFAFDNNNDNLNDGRHLQDTTNLYRVSPPHPTVSARIELTFDNLLDAAEGASKTYPQIDSAFIRSFKRKRKDHPGYVVIHRDLTTKLYSFEEPPSRDPDANNAIAESTLLMLPYILFFDDFRDSVEDKVEISAPTPQDGWLAIFETLFVKTDASFSVHKLPAMEERQRKSVLAKVNRRLNSTLTREWQNFRLDNADALKINLDYFESQGTDATKRSYLKLDVIETDASGDEHFFFVRDRSKGFFWFFNFVMKLEFNPKVAGDSDFAAIYLLDEPGSYLHAAAQSKLAIKLRALSRENRVLYCTHSHHLLDPDVIPINTVRIAEKDSHGNVSLIPIHEHRGLITERRSAFQPLADALQIRPLALDFGHLPILIVEGIVDYHLLEIFRGTLELTVLPSVGADSMKFYISVMIAWRLKYCALWDNDTEGRRAHNQAIAHFGESEARSRFRLLPTAAPRRNRIIQDLVDGRDLVTIRAVCLLTVPLTRRSSRGSTPRIGT
jgi:energy-coupling factor transporter ATP-binding protein EcfA2